jgi:hypothetical protein
VARFGFVLSFNECNFKGGADLETLWSFTSIGSEFYPHLACHYSQLIDDWYAGRDGNNCEALIRQKLRSMKRVMDLSILRWRQISTP